ncbi:hypothetical protein Egran_01903 [Elaphomyces granulatus]|uniref:Uncharacterized protein n=1 Tax=Elaphomyces granulatus TaxID=519963 RepID=A0A232M1T8_9EURO|nr:hypothetical protein Egran_01903 [Elaphomyces granulatus]
MLLHPSSKLGHRWYQKAFALLLPAYYQRGNLQDAINANLVNHARFPEKKLMVLMLDIPNQRWSHLDKAARRQAEEADGDAALPRAKPKRRANHPTEQEPLMDDEITRNQGGVAEGDFRPYAHRDIKPDEFVRFPRDGEQTDDSQWRMRK